MSKHLVLTSVFAKMSKFSKDTHTNTHKHAHTHWYSYVISVLCVFQERLLLWKCTKCPAFLSQSNILAIGGRSRENCVLLCHTAKIIFQRHPPMYPQVQGSSQVLLWHTHSENIWTSQIVCASRECQFAKWGCGWSSGGCADWSFFASEILCIMIHR